MDSAPVAAVSAAVAPEDSAPSTPITTAQHVLQSNDAARELSSRSSKQRQRTRRACYPCSKRKIKCDRDERTPCSNCAKRPNSELCTFEDDRPRSARPRHSGTTVSPTPGLLPDGLKHERSSTPSFVRGIQPTGISHDARQISYSDSGRSLTLESKPLGSVYKANTGLERHTGPQDLPAPPLGQYMTVPPTHRYLPPGQHVLPPASTLTLPGTATIATSPIRTTTEELHALLPLSKHAQKYCEVYQKACHRLFPVDIGLPHVEEVLYQYIRGSIRESLFQHLEARNLNQFRADLVRVALLCASIASGIHASDTEEPSRRILLRQYTTQTMQLLRIADVMSYPVLAAYPVLLIIARLVQDELEPLLSWSLLGSVRRMMQLYSVTNSWTLPYAEEAKTLSTPDDLLRMRHRQESFLSLMLGQVHQLDKVDYPDTRSWSNASYLDCLDAYAAMATYCGTEEIRREDMLAQHMTAMKALGQLDRIALPHLADKQKCRNIHELLEYCTLRIHEKLVHLQYCQIAMSACRHISGHEQDYFSAVERCASIARECIEAYLDMIASTTVPLRSWILTAAVLRATLVLGVLMTEVDPSSTKIDIVGDRDRMRRLLAVFTSPSDEAQPDRARWMRRYPDIFQRVEEMIEASTKHSDERSLASNGVHDQAEPSDFLLRLTREQKDDIIMPTRMVREYFSQPSCDEPSIMASQQVMLGI